MKLEDQVLTIEQAKHLQDLGLDMSDAALCLMSKSYRQVEDRHGCIYNEDIPLNERLWEPSFNNESLRLSNYEYVPTYTLQEVFDKLPEEIETTDIGCKFTFRLEVNYALGYVCYLDYGFLHVERFKDGNLLKAAYKLLCWVIEEGYLKEEEKK